MKKDSKGTQLASHQFSTHKRYSQRPDDQKVISAPKKALTFRSWLKQFKDEDSSYGDLANDAFSDDSWSGYTAKSLAKSMKRYGACSGAWQTFREAVRDYSASEGLTKSQRYNLVVGITQDYPEPTSY
ncbi:hypothetical protein [Nostoc sp.]|uniref:hypothetical protein n=1 Tax=Nostoc sp. TaxID=1180 RepID=UPI002FF4992E